MPFSKLGLSSPIVKAVNALGYDKPTSIQEKAIPIVLSGRNLIAAAQTGTGKTASFVLPI
ncbi:DEAD/DEAH box helicase, partial [Vibrio fortis]